MDPANPVDRVDPAMMDVVRAPSTTVRTALLAVRADAECALLRGCPLGEPVPSGQGGAA